MWHLSISLSSYNIAIYLHINELFFKINDKYMFNLVIVQESIDK